jgi:hypothetical protein
LLTLGQFLSCQKKTFKRIEVHGRLVNFITNEPITGKVDLYADGFKNFGKQQDSGRVLLASVQANSDGTFSLKSSASKGDNYYLRIDNQIYAPRAWPASSYSYIQVKQGENNDIGDIPWGKYTFVIKIKLVPTTPGFSIWLFPCTGDKDYIYFPPNTATTIIQQCEQSYETYMVNHCYPVRWRGDFYNPSDYYILANNYVRVPLSNADTLTYTLNY